MDDLGVHLFQETSISNNYCQTYKCSTETSSAIDGFWWGVGQTWTFSRIKIQPPKLAADQAKRWTTEIHTNKIHAMIKTNDYISGCSTLLSLLLHRIGIAIVGQLDIVANMRGMLACSMCWVIFFRWAWEILKFDRALRNFGGIFLHTWDDHPRSCPRGCIPPRLQAKFIGWSERNGRKPGVGMT